MSEVSEYEQLGLHSIANGQAPVLFNEELQRALRNIVDVNTSDTEKRKVILECTIKPELQDGQHALTFTLECKSKLAGVKSASGIGYVGLRSDGELAAVAHMINQRGLFDEERGPRRVDSTRGRAAAGE